MVKIAKKKKAVRKSVRAPVKAPAEVAKPQWYRGPSGGWWQFFFGYPK